MESGEECIVQRWCCLMTSEGFTKDRVMETNTKETDFTGPTNFRGLSRKVRR